MKRIVVGLVLVAGGCDEERAPRLFEAGDPCHTNLLAECRGEGQLAHCVDRRWVVSSCAADCRALGAAVVDGACAESPDKIDRCECVVADPEGCTPGQLACEGDGSLRECDSTQQWITHSCEDLCEPIGVSLGCRDAEEGIAENVTPAACLCGR